MSNQLLAALPQPDRDRLLGACDEFMLLPSEVLCEAGDPAGHVYFPSSGFISLITRTEGPRGLEVGMVGREGLLGGQWALGVGASPWRALIQGQGMAYRAPAAVFRRELQRSGALRRQVLRHVYVLLAQQALTAACIHEHLLGPRLARWLLMSHDRASDDQLQFTHAFLASMLGLRRVGVTLAIGELQRDGLIHCHRGTITVLDRTHLEARACACYAGQRRILADVMGAGLDDRGTHCQPNRRR